MASRDLTTFYSKLFSRMPVRSPRTLSPPISRSDIPTNNSDSESRSKQLPHAEGKKNRAFNRFLKEGSEFPCNMMKQGLKLWFAVNSLHAKAAEEVDDDPLSAEEYPRSYYGNIDRPRSRYKMGEIVVLKNMKLQMMMRNTCDSRRWFTSRIDAISVATNVESNAFSTNKAGDAINGEGPGILHRMARAVYIKKGKFANIDNLIESVVSLIKKEGKFQYSLSFVEEISRYQHRFFEKKHHIKLENYGLYKKGNIDWHVAGVSKSRYMSIEDFMKWVSWIPRMYDKRIYNYMFKQQMYVLESLRMTLLRKDIGNCVWRPPLMGWYKLNVYGFFKENLGGTKEASCGVVWRDFRGRIVKIFHKPLPDATSREEVLLLGVHYGLDKTLQRRSGAKKIVLEIDHKRIFNVLNCDKPKPLECSLECSELYDKTLDMLVKFEGCDIWFSHGNAVANRVAYIASHLTVGQSFPIGDKGFKTLVRCDRLRIPRHGIFLKESMEIDDSSSDESSDDEPEPYFFSDYHHI
ncbi:uncharacterized protein LOC132276055 [Cornus florida]|uniref:uncharacterized protein LOC132276055 n=1 Tax=Cornus florida TaxID=4283 RepID=UPI0028A1FBC5|nr:uncharacterized protein LOC132276055 [Cornus florida]